MATYHIPPFTSGTTWDNDDGRIFLSVLIISTAASFCQGYLQLQVLYSAT